MESAGAPQSEEVSVGQGGAGSLWAEVEEEGEVPFDEANTVDFNEDDRAFPELELLMLARVFNDVCALDSVTKLDIPLALGAATVDEDTDERPEKPVVEARCELPATNTELDEAAACEVLATTVEVDIEPIELDVDATSEASTAASTPEPGTVP